MVGVSVLDEPPGGRLMDVVRRDAGGYRTRSWEVETAWKVLHDASWAINEGGAS
jgi:hypothetical protein